MKTLIKVFVLLIFWTLAGKGQSITVTYPNGGEEWLVGSTEVVRWTSSGLSSAMLHILCSTDGGSSWSALTGFFSGTALSHSVTVPNTPDLDCRIKVETLVMSGGVPISDQSDGSFSIAIARGTLSLTIYNAEGWGWPAFDAHVNLYDSGGLLIREGHAGSSSMVVWLIPAGTGYYCKVWVERPEPYGTCYWGQLTGITISHGVTTYSTFTRNEPYIWSHSVLIAATNEALSDGGRRQIQSGTKLKIAVTVKNPSTPGAADEEAWPRFILDRDRTAAWDIEGSGNPLTLPTDLIMPWSFECTPTELGEYYLTFSAHTDFMTVEKRLDGTWWYEPAFTVIPLPVQLSAFTAAHTAEASVRLDWTTVSETNNYGFEIERKGATEQNFSVLPGVFIPGHGTTLEMHKYSYLDKTATPGKWTYRLKQIDLDGTVNYSEAVVVDVVTSVSVKEVPSIFVLSQNYPNPFNPATVIRFGLPRAVHASLTVHDLLGQQLAVLAEGQMQAGYHEVRFDGSGLSSGVYFYRMQTGNFTETRRLLLMK